MTREEQKRLQEEKLILKQQLKEETAIFKKIITNAKIKSYENRI